MKKILLTGCGGRMGKVVAQLCETRDDFSVVAGVDPALPSCAFPVYAHCSEVKENVDVIIDFSFHAAISEILEYAVANRIPAVIATTGFDREELDLIEEAEKTIPVFRSANMSLGVNLICQLAKRAAKLLPDFDIEIIEAHHNKKKDAPSGTAVSLAEVITGVKNWSYEEDVRHGRKGIVGARTKKEIGMHAVRGGDIVGDHTVMFAAEGERIELTHRASSRDTFVKGALRAARFLATAKSGYYDMQDVLGLK